MGEVSIRELRNGGGGVMERVAKGEPVTVTRSGRPVAELHPIPRTPVPLEVERSARQAHFQLAEVDFDPCRSMPTPP